MKTAKQYERRYAGEVVELTRDCELGQAGERAVVVRVDEGDELSPYPCMVFVFPNRDHDQRVYTGADYQYLTTRTPTTPTTEKR
jgi:hypothetical protein